MLVAQPFPVVFNLPGGLVHAGQLDLVVQVLGVWFADVCRHFPRRQLPANQALEDVLRGRLSEPEHDSNRPIGLCRAGHRVTDNRLAVEMVDCVFVSLVLVARTVFTPETRPSHRRRFFMDGLLIVSSVHEYTAASRLLVQPEVLGEGAHVFPKAELAGGQQPRCPVLLPAANDMPKLVLAHVNREKDVIPAVRSRLGHLVAGQRDALALDFLPFFPRLGERFLHELTQQLDIAAVRHCLSRQLPLRQHGLAPFRPRGDEDRPVPRADAGVRFGVGVHP